MDYKGATPPRMERKLFGVHETIELPVGSFVRLPQVRSGMNPELQNIKDSIRTRGLLNQIDVARMSADQLDTYVNFVNKTWRTAVERADYAMQQQPDGSYYVVVAGHTRTEAVYQLQEEDDAGYEYVMAAKVHDISTPDELIALQLDENLHSTPAQEQRAIAVVETYQYGVETGLWSNKAEFLREAQGKFSRQILDDAIGFAQLPPEARDYVFAKQIPYAAGVALGRASDTILEYHLAKLGYLELPDVIPPEIEEIYRLHLSSMMSHIGENCLRSSKAREYIEGQERSFRVSIEKRRGIEQEAMLPFTMVSSEEQRQTYLNEWRKESREANRRLRLSSIVDVSVRLELSRRLTGDETIDGLDEERRKRTQLFATSILEMEQARTA